MREKVRRALQTAMLAKAMLTGAYAVATLCGVVLPRFGIDMDLEAQFGAAGAGAVLAASIIILRA